MSHLLQAFSWSWTWVRSFGPYGGRREPLSTTCSWTLPVFQDMTCTQVHMHPTQGRNKKGWSIKGLHSILFILKMCVLLLEVQKQLFTQKCSGTCKSLPSVSKLDFELKFQSDLKVLTKVWMILNPFLYTLHLFIKEAYAGLQVALLNNY